MLLVVFVPMLLDPEPRAVRTGPTLAIPPKDNPPPLPAPSAAPTSNVAAAPSQAPVAAEAKKPEAPPVKAVVDAKAAAVAEVKPAAPAPVPAMDGFAVQVGAFRDEAKLAQSREKLVAAGVVHYTERLDSKGGPLTRLRAGPFPTREAAEAALAKLKRASLDGKVVPLAAEREERKP